MFYDMKLVHRWQVRSPSQHHTNHTNTTLTTLTPHRWQVHTPSQYRCKFSKNSFSLSPHSDRPAYHTTTTQHHTTTTLTPHNNHTDTTSQMLPHTLVRFLLMVKRGYRDPPYHNWMHAFCVGHFFYALTKTCDISDYFTDIEVFIPQSLNSEFLNCFMNKFSCLMLPFC